MNRDAKTDSPSLLLLILLCTSLVTLSGQSYVGAEQCLMCHQDMTGWRTSLHATGFTVPKGANSMMDLYGIVNDADGNGVDDFKDGLDLSATDAFTAYGANAPVLGYDAANDLYTVTIGELTMPVKLTYGGSGLYKQRYMLKIPVAGGGYTASHYVSPVQYNEKTAEYVGYHPEAWYDESNAPRFGSSTTAADVGASDKTQKRSFEKQCVGCHFTHTESVSQNADGEWIADAPDAGSGDTGDNVYDVDGDGTLDLVNTGCERCHGPGSDHVASASPDDIINPADLTAKQANDMCGFCHSRGSSFPNQTFHYPFDDANMEDWEVGDLWEDYYIDHGGYYGDGNEGEVRSSKKHHQQYFDLYESAKPDFVYHQVTCYECHDVHNEVPHQIVESIWEDTDGDYVPDLEIATAADDNTLCLACHATHGHFEEITKEMVADYADHKDEIAAVVQTHTKHPYDPEGTGASNCVECHMPWTIKSAVQYDIRSHTFEAIPPTKTLAYEMPNTCAASCHRLNAVGEGAEDVTLKDWSEESDKTIAEWGDLFMGMWENAEWAGEVGNTLTAVYTQTPPAFDGALNDAVWGNAPIDTVRMTVEGVHNSAMEIQMIAAYTDTDLYIGAWWTDKSRTVRRQQLVYQNGAWSKTDETNAVREDRIGIFWPMTDITDFDSRGCMATCHNTRERWGKYLTNEGELGDMWHSKGARSWPAGYVDDKYLSYEADPSSNEDGGRHGDASGSTFAYFGNQDDNDVPQWMGPTHDTNPAALYDTSFATEPYEGTWALKAIPYSADAGWIDGDRLPKYVMKVPDVGSARADIEIRPVWARNTWTVEIRRPLDTGDAEHDVIFDDLTKTYAFALAIIDNGTQPASSGIYPNLHSHQGVNYEYLEFGERVGVDEETVAALPEKVTLRQNYPNPFNPTTVIKFSTGEMSDVTLRIYNLLGEEVMTVFTGDRLGPGDYKVRLDASELQSGIYFYKLNVNGFVETKKMMVLK